ncbi:5-oxoprolinase subunit PxpA [Leadbettera azotonutricia]|uniref:5-oxoprolinase subunit A n=1 Tax=Leadbettera azotonutricia (strain ATCC BAA-888 / DSM 13862 / ZAS-9) TaxID=545695 RepID=F5YAB0_LEAAZ|nr:5-oxoprolinase subunit PxpA [Leadbettera azotonutricia]AEF80268.1 LamB/YcsF family protein [Leadbettera azotonutricia ZAS-9]
MAKVDLNCDLGESFGAWKMGMDDKIIPLVSSANIACGFHAGDPLVMEKTVALAKQHGVAVGAHPGFPDLSGFGRRNLAMSAAEARACVQYQIGALEAFCKAAGVPLIHVKAHGALYNMAAKDISLARAIAEGIKAVNPGLIFLALAGSCMVAAAKEIGLPVAEEVFADRAYEEDCSLVSRTKPGAMISDEDEAVSRVVGMIKTGTVKAITGKEISVQADSICVHGDGEKALLFVEKLNRAFKAEGIAKASLQEIMACRKAK